MADVEPEKYPSVIREMLRHENDVTNHRIMWLLIGQGLIANAYVGGGREIWTVSFGLSAVGILMTLSTFIILYKSYHARGYLEFLGNEAKRGVLREQEVPLLGWPRRRLRGWRTGAWSCPWLLRWADLLEPYMFLPILLTMAWGMVQIRTVTGIEHLPLFGISAVSTLLLFVLVCMLWTRWAMSDEVEPHSPGA